MKTVFFTLAFVLFTIVSFGQTQTKPTNTAQQKKIGTIPFTNFFQLKIIGLL